MIKANVEVNYKYWLKKIKSPKKYINSKLKIISSVIPFFNKKKIIFTILLTNSLNMKKLNKKFRKKNKSTDVLSFPFYNTEDLKKNKNKNIYIGDIVLNFKKIDKKNFKMDFNRLWIHGFLHLLGYKHFKDKDFYKMNKLEKKILKKIIGNQC